MIAKDLLKGEEFIFENEHTNFQISVSFSEHLDKFGIWVNGQLRTFKTFKGCLNNTNKLKKKYKLEKID